MIIAVKVRRHGSFRGHQCDSALFGDAVEQLGKLVQNETQLAKAELTQKITQAGIGAAYIGGAAILFIPVLVVLLIFLQDKAAMIGVGFEGDVGLGGCAGRGVEMQDEIVGKVGGEDQRGALDGENDRWFDQAGNFIGVGRTQWRRDHGLHAGERNDEDRLGIVEGRRGV